MKMLNVALTALAMSIGLNALASQQNEVKTVKLTRFKNNIELATVVPKLCANSENRTSHCMGFILNDAIGIDADGKEVKLGRVLFVSENLMNGLMDMQADDALITFALAFTPRSEWPEPIQEAVKSVEVSDLEYAPISLSRATANTGGLGKIGRMTITVTFDSEKTSEFTNMEMLKFE